MRALTFPGIDLSPKALELRKLADELQREMAISIAELKKDIPPDIRARITKALAEGEDMLRKIDLAITQ